MRVRPMTVDDCQAVAGLSTQLGYPTSASRIERRFRALADDPDSSILVAEETGGKVIGWLHVHGSLVLESDPCAEIAGLVVDAGARRRGIGRALLLAAESWATGRGYAEVCLRSNTARTDARPFYERQGYEVVKTQYKFHKALAPKTPSSMPGQAPRS